MTILFAVLIHAKTILLFRDIYRCDKSKRTCIGMIDTTFKMMVIFKRGGKEVRSEKDTLYFLR